MTAGSVVLCLNSGSSSLKYALFRVTTENAIRLDAGSIDECPDLARAVSRAFEAMSDRGLPRPDAVAHRLVHGGDRFLHPVVVSDATLAELWEIAPFAPLHMPAEIRAIEAAAVRYPGLPQIACFDTAFHRGLPERSRRLALPRSCEAAGIRRYGFHGLSYAYIIEELGSALGGRAIVAHLGGGASMVALRDRQPIDTTMSFTPAGGLVMGTRSGDLDPGVIFHLLAARAATEADKEGGFSKSLADVERMIQRESGLLGISGVSGDMKKLLALRSHDDRAALAIDVFCYRIKMQIGAFAAALGGLDTLVFTGGIGEHAAPIRAEICTGLEYMGLRLDPAANQTGSRVISNGEGRCTVLVVPTNEEIVIAREASRCLSVSSPTRALGR
jgi:acetate kinase